MPWGGRSTGLSYANTLLVFDGLSVLTASSTHDWMMYRAEEVKANRLSQDHSRSRRSSQPGLCWPSWVFSLGPVCYESNDLPSVVDMERMIQLTPAHLSRHIHSPLWVL
ncbi:hypothetical protein ACJMK2_039556 [Sinanodonta woodiana]|uniref:Uncharacterized protein n=1 Tax=Sinanodonta woodiana TaxID=1069815 RepID=A0ABD3WCE4_SINWO